MATYYYADVRRFKTEREQETITTLESTTLISETNIQTNTSWYVYYVIDVYASSKATFSAWQTAFNTGIAGIDNKGILVSPNSSTNQNNGLSAGLVIGITVSKGTTDTNVRTGTGTFENSHYKISFNRTAKTTSGQVVATPEINIHWTSTSSPTPIKITGINWRTTSNNVPNITWTTTHKQPTFPAIAIEAGTKENGVGAKLSSGYEQNITNYYYDVCSAQWYFLIYHLTLSYSVLWTCDVNGNNLTPQPAPSDAVLATKSSRLKFSKTAFNNFIKIKSGGTDCGAVDQVNYQSIPTEEPKDVYRYNPPPYDQVLRTSFSEKLIYDTTNNYSFRDLYTVTNRLKSVEKAFAVSERGAIYQDVNGAKVLNRNPDKLKESISKGSNQWGFRFTYNPTTFSYSTSSNNSVDWTLGQSDPATLLMGNSTVAFELYLNRIPDLSYLRMQYPEVSQSQLYGRELKQYEIDGILNRGTEYDIEFLYRVLNGDPLKKALLFDSAYTGDTADFGYTSGVPCWLQLNKNLKYFGSVASFQVNHVMFDLNMVPMLSTVSISFSRYPALWTDSNLSASVVGANAIKSVIANSGKAPGN